MPMNGGNKNASLEALSLPQDEPFSNEATEHLETTLHPSLANTNRNILYHHHRPLSHTAHHPAHQTLHHPHLAQQLGHPHYQTPQLPSPQQHSLMQGFAPPTPSPPLQGGRGRGFYLDNEKISPSAEYPQPAHAAGIWYPGATHGAPQVQPQLSQASYRENYPGSFLYHSPHSHSHPHHQQQHHLPAHVEMGGQGSDGLFHPIHLPPQITAASHHILMSAKRDEAITNVSMKLKKKRESHNAVERRRRDNINERIQFLSSIIPECKRRQEQASILTGIDTKRSSIPVSHLKLNKSFILQKATEYIEAMSAYIERQSMLLKEVIPSYAGGIDELNASVVDEEGNVVFSLENSPSHDFEDIHEEREHIENSTRRKTFEGFQAQQDVVVSK